MTTQTYLEAPPAWARATACTIFVATTVQLAVAAFVPNLDQFEGKGFGARLIAYPLMMLALPVGYSLWSRRQTVDRPTPRALPASSMVSRRTSSPVLPALASPDGAGAADVCSFGRVCRRRGPRRGAGLAPSSPQSRSRSPAVLCWSVFHLRGRMPLFPKGRDGTARFARRTPL